MQRFVIANFDSCYKFFKNTTFALSLSVALCQRPALSRRGGKSLSAASRPRPEARASGLCRCCPRFFAVAVCCCTSVASGTRTCSGASAPKYAENFVSGVLEGDSAPKSGKNTKTGAYEGDFAPASVFASGLAYLSGATSGSATGITSSRRQKPRLSKPSAVHSPM